MIKMNEIENLSTDEIQVKVKKLKRELMQLRFQAKTGKLERQSSISEMKRDIARLLTAMSQIKREVSKK